MKLRELFMKKKWNKVFKNLVELYPECKKNELGYKSVFNYILTSEKTEDCQNMRLCIDVCDDSDYCEETSEISYWDSVIGRNGDSLSDFKGNKITDGDKEIEQTWSLAMSSFDYWSSLEIDKKTMKEYSVLDIICHSLWEMTFFGFTNEDIEKQKEKIDRRSKEIEEGKYASITWEEVKEKIEKEMKKQNEENSNT